MQETAKDTLDELKKMPSEIRDRVKAGMDAFLESVRAPFDDTDDDGSPPQHLVPRDGRWAILPQGSQTATRIYDTKADAFSAAQKTAKREGTVLIVHRQDGTVQEIRNYRSK